MGCRRLQPEEHDQVEGAHTRALERRSSFDARRGVLLLVLPALVACHHEKPSTKSEGADLELLMAFPEGNVPGSELGLGQFAGMLSMEGLTVGTVDGRVVPRLAETWRWEDNELTLRVTLRPNVFFHDGAPVDSAIVATIIETAIARPAVRASYPSLADVTSVETDGDLDVVINLARRSGFLPEDLALPISTVSGLGTGPYRLVERTDSELLFEAFDRYYQGKPGIDRIRVATFDTLRSAWTSLLRGEVDMVTDVPAEAVEFVRTDDVDVITYGRWFQFMVGFNSERPVFRSPAVRRALNYAIDRDTLVARAMWGFATSATGPLWPQHWAHDPDIPRFVFDPRVASSLLDAAGLRPGTAPETQTGIPNARLRFTCLLPADFILFERIGIELQKQFYDVGVDMQFELVPLEEYVERLAIGEFEAVLVDMISGPTLGRAYIFWRSATQFKGLNVFGYENPDAERFFEIIKTSSTNEAAVRSAVRGLQRVFLEDPPALFLAWGQRTRAVRTDFRVVREVERDPMPTLWRWTGSDDRVAAAN